MPEPLTPDEKRRWVTVAERIVQLKATAYVSQAIRCRPIPLDALHAAERALDELDSIPGEPDAIEMDA